MTPPDLTTWRAQATSRLRWLVWYVEEARRCEASGNALGAKLAWLGAWQSAERRAELEGRG